MQLEDYTADAICRAMGLSGFIEPAWTERELPTLRIVLTPSFHPETCITISRNLDRTAVSVIVLADRFWARLMGANESVIIPAACLPNNREEISTSPETFSELLELFEKTLKAVKSGKSSLFVDGMGSECCSASRLGTQQFKSHSFQNPNRAFLARVVDVAWSNCKNPQIRNGLAQAASYLGIKYPLQEIPAEPPTTQIAILGTPDARKDYFEMLQRLKDSKVKT